MATVNKPFKAPSFADGEKKKPTFKSAKKPGFAPPSRNAVLSSVPSFPNQKKNEVTKPLIQNESPNKTGNETTPVKETTEKTPKKTLKKKEVTKANDSDAKENITKEKPKKTPKKKKESSGETPNKPRATTGKSLTDEEYDVIFKAVLARYPPITDSQEAKEKMETEKKDDFETIIESDEALTSKYVETFLSQEKEKFSQDILSDLDLEHSQKDKKTNDGKSAKVKKSETTENKPDANEPKLDKPTHSTVKDSEYFKIQKERKETTEASRKLKKIHKEKKIQDRESGAKRPIGRPRLDSPVNNILKSVPKRKHEDKKGNHKNTKRLSLTKDQMKQRDIAEYGTWVQCSKEGCMKWRYLSNCKDPSVLPEKWFCSMNPDKSYNSCDKPEADYDESEHIFTKFTEGSLVWARIAGYPWWPAMVEIDPDDGCFFGCKGDSQTVTAYHVVFFGDKTSRCWTSVSKLKPYTERNPGPTKIKGANYKDKLAKAKEMADHAKELAISDRLRTYSFARTYTGKWDIPAKQKQTKVSEEYSKESKVVAKRITKSDRPEKKRPIYSSDESEGESEKKEMFSEHDEDVGDLLCDVEAMVKDAEHMLSEILSSQEKEPKDKKKVSTDAESPKKKMSKFDPEVFTMGLDSQNSTQKHTKKKTKKEKKKEKKNKRKSTKPEKCSADNSASQKDKAEKEGDKNTENETSDVKCVTSHAKDEKDKQNPGDVVDRIEKTTQKDKNTVKDDASSVVSSKPGRKKLSPEENSQVEKENIKDDPGSIVCKKPSRAKKQNENSRTEKVDDDNDLDSKLENEAKKDLRDEKETEESSKTKNVMTEDSKVEKESVKDYASSSESNRKSRKQKNVKNSQADDVKDDASSVVSSKRGRKKKEAVVKASKVEGESGSNVEKENVKNDASSIVSSKKGRSKKQQKDDTPVDQENKVEEVLSRKEDVNPTGSTKRGAKKTENSQESDVKSDVSSVKSILEKKKQLLAELEADSKSKTRRSTRSVTSSQELSQGLDEVTSASQKSQSRKRKLSPAPAAASQSSNAHPKKKSKGFSASNTTDVSCSQKSIDSIAEKLQSKQNKATKSKDVDEGSDDFSLVSQEVPAPAAAAGTTAADDQDSDFDFEE